MPWNIELPPAEYFGYGYAGLDGLVREIEDQRTVAIDTETDGLILHKCRAYYWSLSWKGANGRDRRVTLRDDTLQCFKRAFADYDKRWVFVNAKFDMHMLANAGAELKGNLIDVAVMHALLFEEESHGLKDMAKELLGWRWTDFGDTFGKIRAGICICGGTKASHENKAQVCKKTGCTNFIQINPLNVLRKMEETDLDQLVDYAANDAYGTLHLFRKLDDMLANEVTWSLYGKAYPHIVTMKDYFYKTEMPFTRVLYACERNGLRVNRTYLEELSPKIQRQLDDILIDLTATTGVRLNPNSNPECLEYLINTLNLQQLSFTKGGKSGVKQPQLDEKFFERYSNLSGVAGKACTLVAEYKKIAKQKGTYIDKMPGRLDKNDRVHPRSNQDVARTGRLSSSDPNLQNVTGGEKDIFHLRKSFIPSPGNDMVVADYSQLEMRLLAAAAQEPAMMEIFHKNWDIHMGNASLVFDIPYEDLVAAKDAEKQVKKGLLPETALTDYVLHCLKARGDAKTIGFGLNYGMKEHALARRMGCTVQEAVAKIEQYMRTYPAVRAFFDSAVEDARKTGFAFTLLGRRRRLPDLDALDDYTRFRAERQASNMPIQGTAAETCKMAMIHIYEDDRLRNHYGYMMLLQVHDEIVGECPKETTQEVIPMIREWMEHPFPTDIGVPLLAEIGSGNSWGEAK